MKKQKGEAATWQNVDTGHKIRTHLTHINVDVQERDSGCTPLLLAVLGGKCCCCCFVLYVSVCVCCYKYVLCVCVCVCVLLYVRVCYAIYVIVLA